MNARTGIILVVVAILAVGAYFIFRGDGEETQQQQQAEQQQEQQQAEQQQEQEQEQQQAQQQEQQQTQQAQNQGDVAIGSLMGVTGALASYVPPIDAAARMAVRDVNEQGGILDGRQLTIVTGDTRADGRTAAAAANRLINVNNVAGIMGALASGATIAAANTAAIPNGVVMISPASTSPAITTLEDNGNIFRVVPSDAFQGVALASALRERGIDKVAITWINNDYGVGLANAFREAYTAQGGEIAGAQVHEPQKSSYQSELASLARGGAEWLIVIAYANDSGPVIIRQALESDLFSNFIGTDGIRSDDMIAQLGPQNLNGMLFSSPGEVSGTQAEQRFVSAFREFSAESVGKPFAAQGYDATFILALAIQKAGSLDRDAIRAAVTEVASAPGVEILPGQWREAREALANGQDVNYVGATGDHEFDENGDVAGVIDIYEMQDGEQVKVQTISD